MDMDFIKQSGADIQRRITIEKLQKKRKKKKEEEKGRKKERERGRTVTKDDETKIERANAKKNYIKKSRDREDQNSQNERQRTIHTPYTAGNTPQSQMYHELF